MVALEILIYGAVLSGIYALLAVGFALIFGVARVINLTHGAFYMLGAYTTFALSAYVRLPLILSIMVTMGIAAMMAALAGGIVGSFLTVGPEMGMLPLIKAFTIVILGGLGSIGGSIIAALLLGYMETMVAYLISSNATELVPLVVIFLTLVFRPAGLFGKQFEF
jgi:branched-chain amino acid transport system permease protein